MQMAKQSGEQRGMAYLFCNAGLVSRSPEELPKEGTVAQRICSSDLLLLTTFLSGWKESLVLFLAFFSFLWKVEWW